MYGAGKENEVCGGKNLMVYASRLMIKDIFKGVWAFCSYLFWPRWGRREDG